MLIRMLRKGALLLALGAPVLRAQDPFEIQVYEYETVPKGRWSLETHVNYTSKGQDENQFHLSFELTRGVTKDLEMAGYLLLAHRSGADFEYAGARLRPRVSVPKEWDWPVDVSFSVEFGFPRRIYEENQVTLEIRPILEKKFGRFQVDINPVFATALKGPTSGVFDFEPGVRLAWETTKTLDLSVEYYGAPGPVGHFLPIGEQVHQIYPGGDLQLGRDLVLNFGVGFGLTDAGNRLVWKMRLGWMFGG